MAAFSQEITRLLLVGDILQKLSDVIQEAVGSQRIFVLIRSGEMYKIVYTASPLEEKNFTSPRTIRWLHTLRSIPAVFCIGSLPNDGLPGDVGE